MRLSRPLRRLAVASVATLGVLIAADIVALQVAESRAATGFAQATAAERASVNLGGFPFLPRLIAGSSAQVVIEAAGVSGGGLRLARVTADVHDLRFSPSGAVALIRSPHAARTRIDTGPSVGRAEILEADLSSFLERRLQRLHGVRITPSGIEVTVVVDAEAGTLSPPARFLPRIENRRLVLRLVGQAELPPDQREAVRSAVEQAIDLPPFPDGLAVEPTLGDGSLALEASTPKLALLVGEGGMRAV